MVDNIVNPPVILLAAWRQEGKFEFETELEHVGLNVTTLDIPTYDMKNRTVRWREILLWLDYLKLAWHAFQMGQHTENAVIVACHSLTGVFVTLFSILMPWKKAQPVVALNLIVRNKGFLNRILRGLIYKIAFLSNQLLITVNAPELRTQYMAEFGIRPDRISVLYDGYEGDSVITPPSLDDDGFVFSGGEADRDWNTLLAVASACPDICFKIVARRINWLPEKAVPPNVEVVFDTDEVTFYTMVARSRLVLLPLRGRATAGLIVQRRSTFLGKMVIATKTPALVVYYPDDAHDLLIAEDDSETMITRLNYYWNNPEERIAKVKQVQEHFLQNFSPLDHARQVADLVQKIAIETA